MSSDSAERAGVAGKSCPRDERECESEFEIVAAGRLLLLMKVGPIHRDFVANICSSNSAEAVPLDDSNQW